LNLVPRPAAGINIFIHIFINPYTDQKFLI
jgi:hypothetical protein